MKRSVFYVLCLLAAAGFLIAPYLIFFVAPIEPKQGFIQKIFFFHVPCAWSMLMGAIASGVAGGVYIFKEHKWSDELGIAANELTLVYGILVLLTGPLWAKAAWGHYWVWDVRLTTVLILFLTFVGVAVARRFSGPSAKKISAGLSLFGAVNVPLIYISVKIWNTIHPKTTVVSSLHPKMKPAFFISLATFTVLFALLLWLRLKLERSRSRVDALYTQVNEQAYTRK